MSESSDGSPMRTPPTSIMNGNSKGGATATATPSQFPQQQQGDFVPYVVRVARLLLSKMEGPVEPAELSEGEPQLTMTSISSLDDLAPFFASICSNVTRQQTRSLGRHLQQQLQRQQLPGVRKTGGGRGSDQQEIKMGARDIINALLERDFLEALPK